MVKFRKHESLRALLSYINRCSNRSWELYFLQTRLNLSLGLELIIPFKPIYFPAKLIPSEYDENVLSLNNISKDGSDIVLDAEFEKKLSFIDKFFKENFETLNKDYGDFLGALAIGVTRLYLPDDRDDERISIDSKNLILKKIDQVRGHLEKAVEGAEEILKHKLIEEYFEKKGSDLSLQFLDFIHKNWTVKDSVLDKSFNNIKDEIESMVEEASVPDTSRNVGTMLIYRVIYNHLKMKSLPKTLSDQFFHDDTSRNLTGKITKTELAEFLTFQIVNLFSDKAFTPFSRIGTLKRSKEYINAGLNELTPEEINETYIGVETPSSPKASQSDTLSLIFLTKTIGPYLLKIRDSQPMNYTKLNKIADEAINAGALKEIESKRSSRTRRTKL